MNLENYYKNRLQNRTKDGSAKIHEHNGKIYVFFGRKKGFNKNYEYDEKPYIYSSWEEAADQGFNII